jgi:hypothetical protein
MSLITTGRSIAVQLSNIAPMRPLDENPIMITFHRYRSASLPHSASMPALQQADHENAFLIS